MENPSNGGLKLPPINFTKLFINGQFVDYVSGKTFTTCDPRTGEAIAAVAEGDTADLDLAVKAAREAFEHGKWPRISAHERGRLMNKFADLVEQHIDEMAALDSLDAGKLLSDGKEIDLPHCIHILRYCAGAADKIHGETLRLGGEFQGYTLREPIGVVGHIIPWNFPSTMFFLKVSPALAAGCTMVVKPAEQTPLSALFYAHLAKQAGIPDGVINVVNGFGATVGAALSSHMDVDQISFTGSMETGRKVMEAAAKSNLKPVSLELGGKSPLIIFDDADLDMAVDLALLAVFHNKVDKRQFERVLKYIVLGKEEGATLVAGGKRCGEVGYYIEPTIFTDVKEDMKIFQDEIFGPVMSLMKFKTIEEAIEKANATKYGLAAGIVTENLKVANRVSRSVRAGTVWINCYFAFDPSYPFDGFKMSGFGRDLGMHAVEKYTQVKFVVTRLYSSLWL